MSDEDGHLWYRDTDEHGGMFVDATVDEGHVLVAIAPAFEFIDPEDADAMADALRRAAEHARQVRARRAAEHALRGPMIATSASSAVVEMGRLGRFGPVFLGDPSPSQD